MGQRHQERSHTQHRDATHTLAHQLLALLYDSLPPTTAIVDYAKGLEKLSANEQLFDDAQTAVSL